MRGEVEERRKRNDVDEVPQMWPHWFVALVKNVHLYKKTLILLNK